MFGWVLLYIFLDVSAGQNADLLLRGPKDQVVSLGQNASFHCDTLSSDVYWRVTGDLEFSSDHPDPSSAAHYLVTDSRDHRYGNTTLTMFTSEQVNSVRITCHYYSPLRINHASRTAYLFACSAPLQEPTDQEVVRGRNASFHCHTRSRSADWMVLEGQIFTPIENYSTMLHYTIREESRNESTTSCATVLTVTTSEWIDNLTIVCSYGPNCTTNAAHLVAVSCLEATPAEHLVVTKAIFYHNYNETLAKVSFEVPLACEFLPINYTVFIMDSAGRIVVSKGPIQYSGAQLVEEELIGFLQNDVVYSIHVEARANGQTAISSNKLRRGTLWSIGCSPNNFTTREENNNRTTGNSSDPIKYQLTVTSAVLGSLVTALLCTTTFFLGTTIRCAGGCHTCGSRPETRLTSLRTMVPNPIYDSPMYESIQQNFSNVTDGPNSGSVVPTTPDCSLGLCYSAAPSENKILNNYANTAPPSIYNIPANAEGMPPASTPCTDAAPPYTCPTKLKTTKERNVLQLTLTLNEDISGGSNHTSTAPGESDNEPPNTKTSTNSVVNSSDEYYALVNPPNAHAGK